MHAMLSNDYKRKVCCMAAGNRKSYALYRMVIFPMTLTDPNPVFKVTEFLKSIISKTVRF